MPACESPCIHAPPSVLQFRWGGSLGSGSSTGIEPPFLHMQAIVNLDVLAW